MREPEDVMPEDQDLHALLRSWEVEGAPAELDDRVVRAYRALGLRRRGWRGLLTMPLRVPVPVALAVCVLLLVIGYLAGRGRPAPAPRPAPEQAASEEQVAGFPLVTETPLGGFRPLAEVKVKVLPKEKADDK